MPDTIPADGRSAIPVKMVSSLSAQYWSATSQQVQGPVLPVKNATNLQAQCSGQTGSYFYAVSDGFFYYLIDEIVESKAKTFDALIYNWPDPTIANGVELEVDTKGAVVNFSQQGYDWTYREPAQLKVELWTATPDERFDTIFLDRQYWDDGSRKYEFLTPIYAATRAAQQSYYPPYKIFSCEVRGTLSSVYLVDFYLSIKWQWDWPAYQIGWKHTASIFFQYQGNNNNSWQPWGQVPKVGIGQSWGYKEDGTPIPLNSTGVYLKVFPVGYL